jgi:hypothetical protein
MPHDPFCDCKPCRYPRVLARFRSEPQVYDDYAKLVAWWSFEREHRAEISEGSVFSLVESPLPKPNAALDVLRSTLRCMFRPTHPSKRGPHVQR